jgi:heme A synthase
MDFSASRPVPRWLHVWAILTVAVAAILLLFGEMVTSLRVGMADPDWPTRPWHLALESRDRWSAGYLVEHTHRILGFLVGGLASVLALGAWCYEPRKSLRWGMLAALAVLLVGYGDFHGQMMAQINSPSIGLPLRSTSISLAALTAMLALCAVSLSASKKATGVRVLSAAALVAVMIQGLLGGLRVRLNDLVGTDLAAVHGVFATLVLSLLIAVAVLSAKPRRGPWIREDVSRKLRWQTTTLVLFTLIQIVWGAWIRHFPGPLSNRLHLLFAFVVVGFATLAIKQALSDPAARDRLKIPAYFFMGLITLQVLLGVEAWVGKFLTGTLPEFERITAGKAFLRTAHAHVGAWVLAVSVVFALIARRNPVGGVGPGTVPSVNSQQIPASEPVLAG